VNYGAGGYSILDHSKWDGLSLADLVFPIFVWTQGVSMAISFASARRRGATASGMLAKVLARAAKLFGLGLFLNNGSSLSEWRVLGVLQYFAVSYAIVGTVEVLLPPVAAPAGDAEVMAAEDQEEGGRRHGGGGGDKAATPATLLEALWADYGRYAAQWAVMTAIAALYLTLQYLLPVPGCPTGYTGPAGLSGQGALLGAECAGGAHGYVDRLLFGEHHIYHRLNGDGVPVSAATCADTYLCNGAARGETAQRRWFRDALPPQ
jgi:heparan-alpha-glucosaminide N-acetyltransferase